MINGGECFESFRIFTRVNYGASDVTKNKKKARRREWLDSCQRKVPTARRIGTNGKFNKGRRSFSTANTNRE
jgi:hypothetical protein